MSKPSEVKSKPPSWVDVRDAAVKAYAERLRPFIGIELPTADFIEGADFGQQFEAKRSARLLDALEKLTMTEENRNRLDQVDSDTLQRLLVHMSIVATEAIREYRETE